MKNKLRIPLLLVYIAAMLALYILSVDKYSWMREVDPYVSPRSININTANGYPLATITFVFILALQLLWFTLEKRKKGKVTAVVLALAAALFYLAGVLRLL
ncbi:hypothetical protein [Scandinavium sp.]|uniref:hypothetical protein n=1 Tax=Scandinavium sp. TaxID=2830653 RepID=UPI002898F2BB|nr:hypothetical protein [Scandinavium sp.]